MLRFFFFFFPSKIAPIDERSCADNAPLPGSEIFTSGVYEIQFFFAYAKEATGGAIRAAPCVGIACIEPGVGAEGRRGEGN